MIGEVLQGFQLTAKVGESSTGETYLASGPTAGQKATVQVLRNGLVSDPSLLGDFFARAKTGSEVRHPGVVALVGAGVHSNGRPFLLLEPLVGSGLADALATIGRVDDSTDLAELGRQAASVLATMHAAGMVHGALQPDSFFLTFPPEREGRPLLKLLDVGVAALSPGFKLRPPHSVPYYLSPEAVSARGRLDPRADVYSLGCILFEMACGRPPFVCDDLNALLSAHATTPAPSVTSLVPSVPHAISTLVSRMLEKRREARPQGMTEVARALEVFVRGAPLSHDPPATAGLQVPSVAEVAARSRQEPTALLPPTSPLPSPRVCSTPPATWVDKVQQRTAILEPRVSHPRHPRYQPVAPTRPRAMVSLPVVLVTAAIVIAAGVGVLLLRRGKHPTPVRPRIHVVEAPGSTSQVEAFQVDDYRPASSIAPASAAPLPTDAESDGAAHPGPVQGNLPVRPTRPERRPPARRW